MNSPNREAMYLKFKVKKKAKWIRDAATLSRKENTVNNANTIMLKKQAYMFYNSLIVRPKFWHRQVNDLYS